MELIERLSRANNVTLVEINGAEISRQGFLYAWLILIGIIGVPGNALVLHLYKTRIPLSNYKVFVLTVALTDLLSCSLAIPLEIFLLFHVYDMSNELEWVCKLSRFTNAFMTCSSCYLLLFVAVDRYRKVCKPLQDQISPILAKLMCVFSLVLGLLVSWPMSFVYGQHTATIKYKGKRVRVIECSTSDAMSKTSVPFYYALFLGIMAMTGISLVIVLYCAIGCKIKRKPMTNVSRSNSVSVVYKKSRRRKRSEKDTLNRFDNECKEFAEIQMDPTFLTSECVSDNVMSLEKSWSTDDAMVNSDDGLEAADNGITSSTAMLNCSVFTLLPQVITELETKLPTKSEPIAPNQQTCNVSLRNKVLNLFGRFRSVALIKEEPMYQRKAFKRRLGRKQQRARKKAFVMALISLIYIISFLPYIVIVSIRTTTKGFVESFSNTQMILYRIGLRTFFTACGVNPFICIICDTRLRQELKNIILSFLCGLIRRRPNSM